MALRRIQELTTDGLNLEGVKRVMALEAELENLRAKMSALVAEARASIEETHRQYRRDLVPVQNTLAVRVDATTRRKGNR